tara:strand:+ start:247 stop:453 length:207 start_codon:yes stop_codon:yes gene_type:complete
MTKYQTEKEARIAYQNAYRVHQKATMDALIDAAKATVAGEDSAKLLAKSALEMTKRGQTKLALAKDKG